MNNNNDNEEHVAIVEQRQEYCHMVLFEGWGVGSKLSQGSLAVSLVCKDHTFGSNIERISTLEN